MKKVSKILALVLVCSMLLCGAANAETYGVFKDIPLDASYGEAVEVLSEMGIINGFEDGTFRPDDTITRAQAAKMICCLLGVGDDAKQIKKKVFSDVPTSHWAAGYVAKAAEMGIINGYTDGTFKPESPVKQQEIIKMVVCAIGFGEESLTAGGYPDGYISIVSDLNGLNKLTLTKTEPASRAMVSQLIFNLL